MNNCFGFDENTFLEVPEYLDIPMPDVRSDWREANEGGSLGGCGLHGNFTYDDLVGLEESLRERRILADVPTPDVLEFREEQKRASAYRHRKRSFRKDSTEKEASYEELKKKLKQEIIKELLEEMKNK